MSVVSFAQVETNLQLACQQDGVLHRAGGGLLRTLEGSY